MKEDYLEMMESIKISNDNEAFIMMKKYIALQKQKYDSALREYFMPNCTMFFPDQIPKELPTYTMIELETLNYDQMNEIFTDFVK